MDAREVTLRVEGDAWFGDGGEKAGSIVLLRELRFRAVILGRGGEGIPRRNRYRDFEHIDRER